MKHSLVMIPALGCDSGLYEKIAAGLADLVTARTIISGGSTIAAGVVEVLTQAPAEFIILGTSFGGRVALEVAIAGPGRVKGLWVIGAGSGPAADPAAGRERSAQLRGGEFKAVIGEMATRVIYEGGTHAAQAAAVRSE